MASRQSDNKNKESIQYAFEQNELRANAQMSNVLLGFAVCLIIVWVIFICGGLKAAIQPVWITVILLSISFVLVIIWSLCGNFYADSPLSKFIITLTLLIIAGFLMSFDLIYSLLFFAATIIASCRYFNRGFILFTTLSSVVFLFASTVIGAFIKPIFNNSNSVYSWMSQRFISSYSQPGFSKINELFYLDNGNYFRVIAFRLFVPEAIGILLVGFVGILIASDGQGILNEQKEIADKNAQAQIDLTKSQALLTVSQIQPHFLFNALNSIYYLCAKDPKEAQNAIDSFSTYLRMNIDTMSTDKPVPFAKELDHIKTYLYLEKIRFEERLNVEYDIKEERFFIPPLSIQPLVENAVKHGVCKKPEGGTVKISSYKEGDFIVISIVDDGAGFDTSKAPVNDGREHIGLANIKKRLTMLCDAEINIESTIGVGTSVTIKLPLERVNHQF